jgi:hypothetical protein
MVRAWWAMLLRARPERELARHASAFTSHARPFSRQFIHKTLFFRHFFEAQLYVKRLFAIMPW